MTPGEYVHTRRNAAGRSRADVALRFHTDPPLPELARVQLLASIEIGLTPMCAADVDVLAAIPELRIDRAALLDLIDAHVAGANRPRLIAAEEHR